MACCEVERAEREDWEDVEQSDGEPGVESWVQSSKVGFMDRIEGLTLRVTCFFFFPSFSCRSYMHLKLRADAVLPVKECVKSWHATCFGYVCVCVYELTCRVLFDEGSERVEKVVRIPDGVSEDFCLTHVRFPSFFPRRSLQANIHWIYLCFFSCQLSCLCQEASICISQTTATTKKTNPHKKNKNNTRLV